MHREFTQGFTAYFDWVSKAGCNCIGATNGAKIHIPPIPSILVPMLFDGLVASAFSAKKKIGLKILKNLIVVYV